MTWPLYHKRSELAIKQKLIIKNIIFATNTMSLYMMIKRCLWYRPMKFNITEMSMTSKIL